MPAYKRNGEIAGKRPLVKHPPKILLSSAESILSMEFRFSCLDADCSACQNKQKQNTSTTRCIYSRTIRFHDSLQILPASLSDLVQDLTATARATQTPLNSIFAHSHAFALSQGLQPHEADRFVTAKLTMPFQEFKSASHLQNIKTIPKREVFVNELSNTNTPVNVDTYKDFVWSWEVFKCENLLDLANIYVSTDAAQLVDITMYHFKKIMELTSLWPGFYITAR